MDWYSWLSKTSLEPSLVHDYSFAFAHNELEEEDIAYFDHQFLQSMGISIAKHRLEILKLSHKHRRRRRHTDSDSETTRRRVEKLLSAIKHRARQCLGKYLRAWTSNNSSSSSSSKSTLVLVKGEMLKRNRNRNSSIFVAKQGRLMITGGSPMVVSSRGSRVNSFSSPLIFNNNNINNNNKNNYYLKNSRDFEEEEEDHDIDNDPDDIYWSNNNAIQDMRWDTLFHDLKPN